MTKTIRERLAVLETQIKGVQKSQWFLIAILLGKTGIEIVL